MARVIVTLKIMPEGPETNLDEIAENVESILNESGEFYNKEIKPVAFGLNELNVIFILDEDKANELEKIEEKIRAIEGVNSVETIDVRRAIQ